MAKVLRYEPIAHARKRKAFIVIGTMRIDATIRREDMEIPASVRLSNRRLHASFVDPRTGRMATTTIAAHEVTSLPPPALDVLTMYVTRHPGVASLLRDPTARIPTETAAGSLLARLVRESFGLRICGIFPSAARTDRTERLPRRGE